MDYVFGNRGAGWAPLNPGRLFAASMLALAVFASCAATGQCRRAVMRGQAVVGREWSESIGEGWVFRLVPIDPGTKGYSGWDLVVDRSAGTGFPDALLLATPPYDSINQREVGTTFGLRAQDAIGWNPRSFRFLTRPTEFQLARKLYFGLHNANPADQPNRKAVPALPGAKSGGGSNAAARKLMEIAAHSSAGQFRILDAQITPGTANAMPFAQDWAVRQRYMPHSVTNSASPTPLGRLDAIQFEVTLWLPAGWQTPRVLDATPSSCP